MDERLIGSDEPIDLIGLHRDRLENTACRLRSSWPRWVATPPRGLGPNSTPDISLQPSPAAQVSIANDSGCVIFWQRFHA